MSSGLENPNRDHWLAKARRVAHTVNFAWWLETLSAPLLVTAVIGAAGLLVVRREFSQLAPWIPAAIIGTVVLLLALGCWAWAARKFEKPDQSLVRIEAAMQLKNSLSAAQAGVSPWPTPLGKIDAGLAWQWPRLWVPLLGAVTLLAAGLWIPVTARSTDVSHAPDQPQAWKQLDSELDHLTKEQVVDEKYLEETRKRLEELKFQKEEQWFSHASLEATDSLKKSHRAETARVEQELGRAEKTLESLMTTTNQAEQNRLMEEFDQALQGLQNGALKPNPALLEQMKQLSSKEMKNLTPEQVEQLRENLKKTSEAMKDGQENGKGEGESDQLLAGEKEDGNGGVDRGPGHSPGVLGKEKESMEIGELTGLEAKDLSQATPGDLLEFQEGEHDVDERPSQITGGGNTNATGKGGDRVWKDALNPAEQRTLKRFFE